MNRFAIFGLLIVMFFTKNYASANYEKVFYDFKIKAING